MTGRRWAATASLALLALLVIPGVSWASSSQLPATTASPSLSPASSSGGGLPAILSASWAERSGFIPAVRPDASSVKPAAYNLSVAVTLWPRNLSLFVPRTPGAPTLTSAEFDAAYSPSVAEYQSVIGYFEGFGLTILHTWPDRLSVTLEGPAPTIAKAFGTTLLQATVAGRPVQYPQTVPALPSGLAADISAVSGLSEGFTAFTLPVEPVASSVLAENRLTTALDSTTTEVTPSGAHGAYGLDPLYNLSGTFHSATGQNIVLLLWGDGYAPSDISTFFSTFYPSEYPTVPTVRAYPIDGAPAPSASAVNDPSGGPQELTLDIEWSGSMAPGATLDAVYAPDGPAPSYSPNDTPMEDALSYAVNMIPGVSVISMSFGLPESEDPSFQMQYTTLFAEAEAKGITVVGASGDDGGSQLSHGNCTPTPEVEFPASSPDVLAVGGTAPTLVVSLGGQVTGIVTQPAWNKSGGGFSADYAAPSWQLVGSAKTVIGSNGRGVPDVAGPASDNLVYYNGKVGQLAGTSFATPMWAGIIAEIDAVRGGTLGLIAPRLYAIAASEAQSGTTPAFSDVTSGGNCLHSAATGWDPVTGWGTPHVYILYAALTSTFVDLGVSPSPTSVFPGGSTTVSVVVDNGTSGKPVAGVSVNLTFSASPGYTGPCGGTFGTSSVVTNANGTAHARFSVPFCYFGGQAQVSALLLSDGFFGQASATVTVSLLSGSGFVSLISEFPYNVLFFAIIVVLAVLIGALLSRRGRKRPTAYPPPLEAAGSAYVTPSWVNPPMAPSIPRSPPSGGTVPAPWLPPSSAAPGPPSAAPSPSGSTAFTGPPYGSSPPPPPVGRAAPTVPGPVRCPACGAMIPTYSLSCPKCGLARP